MGASMARAIHQGPLKIDVDGETLQLHVVASSEKGKLFRTKDRTLYMNWGGETRGFLSTREMDGHMPNMFFNFSLINKELSYDIDMSKVGCSCNAALFFVTMPGFSPNGSIARGVEQNPYYCDASCTIDTRKPFRIHQSYEANPEGVLVRIFNSMTQDDRVFGYETCTDSEYLAKMTQAFTYKMVMVFQLWGDTWENMQWLDKMTGCTGPCIAEDTELTFSNIEIKSLPEHGSERLIV